MSHSPLPLRRISVIGAGRVGTALALALGRLGCPPVWVASRDRAAAERAVALAGGGAPTTDAHQALDAELVLLTVPDGAIAVVAAALAAGTLAPGLRVCHTSGAASSALLDPLARRGARTASAHPLQSFTAPEAAAANLPGTVWALEGDPHLVAELETLVVALEGRPLRIRTEQKVLYHAGAAVASNYLVALTAVATRLLEAAGIAPADGLAALLPLIGGTVANLERVGLPEALTGPISRGDAATVRAHLDGLASLGDPALTDVYRLLGLEAVDLAVAAGRVDAERETRLRTLLDRADPTGSR